MRRQIYGFMRKVSMRHVDMARDSDVSVWSKDFSFIFWNSHADRASLAHYELNRYSSAGKLMSYKRRVGPRHYARKTGPQAPASSTKNFLFPNGVPDGVRYESIAPPSALMSPQQLALATATPATPSCQVLAFGSPYSVSTNIIYQQCLPDTSASVSPVRPIRTHGKGHKMSAGTLPMPSFHSRSSSGMYPNGGRNVPQNSIASQHSVFSSSNRSGTSKSVKIEDTMGDYSSTGILQGGLWQSLLGNASMPQAQMNNNVQFPSGLFPTLGSPEYPLARASFQPLVGSTYTQMGNAHAQSMNVSSRQSARPLAPSTAQMVYPPGHYVPVGSNGHTPNQPSRTLSNSSTSSSMLMTPPRLETFKIETEQVDQSPVFASFSLSLGHLSQGNYSNAISGGMDNTIEMQQVEQAAENEKNLTIAGNQVFASFLHDMGSSPAPSAAETHTETRPTPAVAMHVSSPETDQDSATHEMFINSFETVRPQAMKPSSSSKMQVVIADIEETENDMRYFEQTFRSRQVKLAGDQAQRQGAANALAVVKKEGRSLDEQDLNDGLRPRGGSFMDKTLRQADGYDDSAACEFDAWMVVQHTMDA
ncbi:hypothetical protein QFC24_006376 [Naganishia onofrii]|uniref:Uncharacterized protein n=1 Tax=Naganishia onofrii TaxID=1851511 RepID=A0ACC2X4J3_9TREE|nr:hypothetical protein QFC24_006376 [Naganishia onofrii]